MDLAIFWLPLIGGILLGGIAGNAWYGGDKILALWLGFAGLVCLLLVGVIQIQQSIMKESEVISDKEAVNQNNSPEGSGGAGGSAKVGGNGIAIGGPGGRAGKYGRGGDGDSVASYFRAT